MVVQDHVKQSINVLGQCQYRLNSYWFVVKHPNSLTLSLKIKVNKPLTKDNLRPQK